MISPTPRPRWPYGSGIANLETLVERTDEIMSCLRQQTFSACNVTDDHSDNDDPLPDLPSVHRIMRRDSGPRIPARTRNSPPAESLCYYLKRFGQAACQCPPCTWSAGNTQPAPRQY